MGENEKNSKKFNECNSAKKLLSFFNNDEQSLRHKCYFHYTSLKNVNEILDTKILRFNSLAKTSNDNSEKEKYMEYEKNEKKLFSLCFSTGMTENLPLWYLYSGIDGCGARIGFTKKSFSTFKDADYFIVEINEEYPFDKIGKRKKLNKKNYTVICRDILYIGEDAEKSRFYRAKYNGSLKKDISEKTYKSIEKEYSSSIKGLIWFYEKETRVTVEITKTDLLDPQKNYAVLCDIKPVFKDLSIRLAPEFGKVDENFFEKYKGIKEWTMAQLQKSDFAGQIKMNLKERMCNECHVKCSAENCPHKNKDCPEQETVKK